MLATLERPIPALVGGTGLRLAPVCPPTPSPSSATVLRLVAAPRLVPAAGAGMRVPVPAAVKTIPASVDTPHRASLRMTVRARRLLAGFVLLCAAGIGVVAVDLLAAVVPTGDGASYAAQEEPYVADGALDSAGLAPASESSITVATGDTLWSLAEEVDPQSDPRDLIAAIMTLNDLDSPTIVPGQVLVLP